MNLLCTSELSISYSNFMNNDQSTSQSFKDEDLSILFKILYDFRFFIAFITILCAIISTIYSLSLSNIYRSETLLAPMEQESGLISNTLGDYGGLASMANLVTGKKASKTDEGLKILESRKFIGDFISNYDLFLPLLAVKNWEIESGNLVYDENIYDVKQNRWLLSSGSPSIQDAYLKFLQEHLFVSQERETGFITLAIHHSSPLVAKNWLDLLVSDLNEVIKKRDVLEAETSISYLKEQLKSTSNARLKDVFYFLIQEQTKTIMLANGMQDYIFRTLDPPVVPQYKLSPSRSMICIVGTGIGAVLSICLAIFLFSMNLEIKFKKRSPWILLSKRH